MRALGRPLAPIMGLLTTLILMMSLAPMALAVDPAKYSGIQDDEPNPLPAYASEADKQLLDARLEELQSGSAPQAALAGPPMGTVWTPGEYEAVEGVMIRWGSFNSLLTEFAVGVTAASANMCTAAATPYSCCTGSGTGTCDDPATKVFVLVENGSQQSSATSTLTSAGADMSEIDFITYNGDSVWIRDYGPRSIYENSTRVMVDHEYNRPTRPNDNAFPEYVAELWNERLYDLGLLHGGGNFVAISTGEGFLSDLALDPDEDGTDEYTPAEIIAAFDQLMNVDVTLYPRLPDSVDATGHIDMWLMPVSDTTFIVSEFTGGIGQTITDAGAADLTSRGYTVYRTPAWNVGSTHYTYANAAIVNNKVFIPWYSGYPTENAAALATYQTAMPNHVVIQVDTSAIIPSAGAIHCVMQHVFTPCAEDSLTISGTVLDEGAAPVEGVSLMADNGGGWATTDASGNYQLCVPDGWSGTIAPDLDDFGFDPTSRTYANVTTDVSAQDYTAESPLVVLGPDDFEGGLGGWANVGGDVFDWTLGSGGTPSGSTGPSVDHTTGTGTGTYLFTEASSPRNPGDTAILESACIDLTGMASSTLGFWYHMYGASMGTLEVQVASSPDATCSSPGGFATVLSETGNQGDQWLAASVPLDVYTGGSVQLRFVGTIGSSYTSDMAIDDVVVTAAEAVVGVCGDGNVDPGEQCDDGNSADGDCCSSACLFEPSSTVCRASAGVCDVAETCDGAGSCAADAFEPSTTECRSSAGVCDVAETCTGTGAACPADGFEPVTTECRAAAGECDAAETCSGIDADCPVDGKLTSVCRASVGVCDSSEFCDGVTNDCPVDEVLDGVPCIDGDVCNGDEVCVVGVCTPSTPLDCDDFDVCTADACDSVSGCTHDPIPGCVPAAVPSVGPIGLVVLCGQLAALGAALLLQRRRQLGA